MVIAGVGVGYPIFVYGQFPWLAFVLAGSFGFYGLLRKTAEVGSLLGLALETGLLTPLALGYLIYLGSTGSGSFGASLFRYTDIASCVDL